MLSLARLLPILAVFALAACAETQFASSVYKSATKDSQSQGAYKVGKPYLIDGQEYYPQENFNYVETGIASWYGPGFHGKQTANGERFDSGELTAAHRTLQMPSLVRVTNLENGRAVVCRVNDRGPYSRGRILDVSSKAADLLGMKGRGTAKVRVEVLPAESRRMAEDAKAGKSTRGYEVALNGNRQPANPSQPVTLYPDNMAVSVQTASADDTMGAARISSVEKVQLEPYRQVPVQGHIANDGRFMPNPVVTHQPVTASNVYIQAGAFADQANAQRLSQSLSSYGTPKVVPVNVGGQSFYRVRIGPFSSVDQADATLGRMLAQGTPKAVIVVE